MASTVAVATKRAIAENRLRRAIASASDEFGVPFSPPVTPSHKHPDLASAELVESVAAFIEDLTRARAEAGGKERP